MHGQGLEQLLHHLLRHGADVQSLHKAQNLLHLLLRDLIAPQAQGQEHPQLLLQRQRPIAGADHVAPHKAGGAKLQGVEVLLRQLRLIGAEDPVQLPGGGPENKLGHLAVGIALHIDLPQVLVQLRQGHLDGGLRGVDIGGGQLLPGDVPGHGELVGEHELRQLRQDAVLGPEDILENAVGHRRLVDDLRHGGFFVTLLQKQLDADRQNPFFGGQTGACDGRNTHFLPYIWHACHNCNRDFRKRQGEFGKKPRAPGGTQGAGQNRSRVLSRYRASRT